VAVQSGLGVTVLGASSVLPDMTILDEKAGMPPLLPIEIGLYGAHSTKSRLIEPLLEQLRFAYE